MIRTPATTAMLAALEACERAYCHPSASFDGLVDLAAEHFGVDPSALRLHWAAMRADSRLARRRLDTPGAIENVQGLQDPPYFLRHARVYGTKGEVLQPLRKARQL